MAEMINKIITERLNDGQLSDSPLTLKDIKIIANTFNRIMKGMMHDRVKYQKSDLTELEDPNRIQLAPDKDELLEKSKEYAKRRYARLVDMAKW